MTHCGAAARSIQDSSPDNACMQLCWSKWLQFWPPICQQVSHQSWIWGTHCIQAVQHASEWIQPGTETQGRRHHVLQKLTVLVLNVPWVCWGTGGSGLWGARSLPCAASPSDGCFPQQPARSNGREIALKRIARTTKPAAAAGITPSIVTSPQS